MTLTTKNIFYAAVIIILAWTLFQWYGKYKKSLDAVKTKEKTDGR